MEFADCDLAGASANRSVLDPVIAALAPVSVRTQPIACYCARRDCSCAPGCQAWWEQMAKVRACYEDVVAHERTRGEDYDFVLKLRSDYDLVRNGLTAAAFAGTLLRSVYQQPRISMHPWGPCYMNLDWAWVAHRSLAHVAFSIDRASCAWLRCIARANDAMQPLWPRDWYRVPPLTRCHFVERGDPILAEWFIAHGAPFETWTTQPEAYNGIGHNGGCHYDAQRMGLVAPSTHRTQHVGGLTCGRDLPHPLRVSEGGG